MGACRSLALCVFAMFAVAAFGQSPKPERQERSKSATIAAGTATLSFAGLWTPVSASKLTSLNNGILGNTFSGIFRLGTSSQYGLVVTGWSYSGFDTSLTTTTDVSIALLTPDAAGTYGIRTAAYISDQLTHGGGSVVIADFNGDGHPDIFLAAHNESPFVAMPSTAYLSNPDGTFSKSTIADRVMAHDAQLAFIDQRPVVVASTFKNSAMADGNQIYAFTNNSFEVRRPPNLAISLGAEAALAPFGAQRQLEMVRGDIGRNYNPITGFVSSNNLEVYAFDGTDVVSNTAIQVITPYLSTLPQYSACQTFLGPGMTHTYRVWSDDLNQDGAPDILVGNSMWSQSGNTCPSALQVLINRGDGTFGDVTESLNPEMSLNTQSLGYTPSFVDLDSSGINSYLFAASYSEASSQSNYVLLNDGTGRLYVALHDEFQLLSSQVYAYLNSYFAGQQDIAVGSYSPTATTPKFIGIPQSNGSLNFVAELPIRKMDNTSGIWQAVYAYVDVKVNFNPTTDFVRDLAITARNGSHRIRTFAGNDTIMRILSDPDCNIDGGLGTNTVVYPGNKSAWIINKVGATFTVRPATGTGGTDTLTRIHRAQFDDQTVQLIPVVPGPPTIGVGMPGDTKAFIYFSVPTNDGGTPITTYRATCNPAGAIGSGLTAPIVVAGLVNGTSQTCSVTAINAVGASNGSATVSVTPSTSVPPALLSVQSRKIHGSAGTFDLPIDIAQPLGGLITVEPRTIGTGHTIVFQFNGPVSASGTASVAPVGYAMMSSSGNEVLVTLTNVPDNQRGTVTLVNVNGSVNPPPVSLGFLVGDVNNSRSVNSSDISGVKARSGQTTDASNFKFDVNAAGAINSSDISAVKARSGLVLP